MAWRRRASAFVLVSLLLTRADAAADVIDRSPSGFTVKTVVAVAAAPQRVYRGLDKLADIVNTVLSQQVQRLKASAEKSR